MLHPKYSKSPVCQWWEAVIGAGASLLGGAMANKSSEDSTDRQIEFQRDMSNTAYYRQVEDLKRAGINPMMVTKLGGASTPAGASMQYQDVLTPAVNSAMAARRNKAEVENMELQGDLLKAQRDKTAQETINLGTQQSQVIAQTSLTKAQERQIDALIANTHSSTDLNRQLIEKSIQDVKESFAREDVAKAEAVLKKLSQEEAKVVANFFKSELGEANPFVKALLSILSVIKR